MKDMRERGAGGRCGGEGEFAGEQKIARKVTFEYYFLPIILSLLNSKYLTYFKYYR